MNCTCVFSFLMGNTHKFNTGLPLILLPPTKPSKCAEVMWNCSCEEMIVNNLDVVTWSMFSLTRHSCWTVWWPEGCCVLQRLVVCLEESIYIHNIKDMKLLKTLLNTPSNPSGKLLCQDKGTANTWFTPIYAFSVVQWLKQHLTGKIQLITTCWTVLHHSYVK